MLLKAILNMIIVKNKYYTNNITVVKSTAFEFIDIPSAYSF